MTAPALVWPVEESPREAGRLLPLQLLEPVAALHARNPRGGPVVLDLAKVIKGIERRQGRDAAVSWTQALMKHQRAISEVALRNALQRGNLDAIAKVVGGGEWQRAAQAALEPALTRSVLTATRASEAALRRHNVQAHFDAINPNAVVYGRQIAASAVVRVSAEVRESIRVVIAQGQAGRLTIDDQARAIREVVGLPPNWAKAPHRLAQDLRTGRISDAVARRLSAVTQQQIRSHIARGTVTASFVNKVREEYTASLINLRARTIARTESARAAMHGLNESWKEAMAQGSLPDTARRLWLVTPDERLSPEHARIPFLNPRGRKFGEPFRTPDGPVMEPPARPNCRCRLALVFTPPPKHIRDSMRLTPARASTTASPAQVRGAVQDAFHKYSEGVKGENATRALGTLNRGQREAIRSYVGSSDSMNTALRRRKGRPLPEAPDPDDYLSYEDLDLEHARQLDSILAKPQSVLRRDVVTYRGLSGKFVPKSGTVFRDHAFASTSFNLQVAEDFAATTFGQRNAVQHILRIGVRKGQRGIPIFRTSGDLARTERELVLPRGTKFRVKRRRLFDLGEGRYDERPSQQAQWKAYNDLFRSSLRGRKSTLEGKVMIIDVEIV